jgi:hypothetical protein
MCSSGGQQPPVTVMAGRSTPTAASAAGTKVSNSVASTVSSVAAATAGSNSSMVSAAASAAAAAAAAQPKRARTRITDEQLSVLREYFDINNSPTEEQIHEMSRKSGLPQKVIKHWFRNTLFKERQRNKDCPYNFSVPPTFKIDLEEYEKTGEAKIITMDESESTSITEASLKMIERVKAEKAAKGTNGKYFFDKGRRHLNLLESGSHNLLGFSSFLNLESQKIKVLTEFNRFFFI